MTNLPTPQSRIEELMKAFITRDMTGLAQPQSRIEEYWHHMIEGTNIMPIPQSRVEALLKRIIENNTNDIPHAQSRIEEFLISILIGEIDNLPIPQSRSEIFLDYIARNNRPVEDIEYISYSGTNITAYNTIEKPIKSAILKGQTLVNLVPRKIIDHIASSDWDGYCCLVQNSKQSFDQWRTLQDLKPNTKYYISCYVETFEDANNKDYCLNNPSVESIFEDSMIINSVGRYQWLSTTKSELTDEIFIVLRSQNAHARGAIKIRDIMIIEYQKGMENRDIPYFEGMQSVKMPVLTTCGKNLFDMNRPYDAITDSQATVVQDTNQITVSSAESGIYVNANFILDKDFFAGKTVTGSCLYESDIKDIGTVQITYQDGNGDHHYQWIKTPKTFTFPNNFIGDVMLCVSANNTGTPQSNTVTVKNIQLELGATATSYEPHKTNILTVNEDVTLCKVGDVQDELDLKTGELTQRIGEVVFDGSEEWRKANLIGETMRFSLTTQEYKMKTSSDGMCDKIPYIKWNSEDVEHVRVDGDAPYGNFIVWIKTSRLSTSDTQGFKQWLSQNPIAVQYELATESIKTVDLKVVNQDGNQVKELSAFDGTTYIVSGSASDNSLIAITEVEVPTKLIEVLDGVKSLSSDVEILINEVDNTQKLQDENSTMAMSAMTELYEMILMMGGND